MLGSTVGRIEPSVSAVIPTVNRPHLVGRAVRSALAQTLDEIEVIVVVDGPDEATVQALRHIHDARLRVKTLPLNLGPGGARNAGVSEARSPWIAFLDDDDEWFPQKLETQFRAAQQSACLYPIISCRFIAHSKVGDFLWPRREPRPNEHLSDYLFCQKSMGEAFIATPTVFTKKELLQRVRFRDFRRAQDIDWLLRATTIEGAQAQFVPTSEPLAIWHMRGYRNRMINRIGWTHLDSLSWIQANRHLVTPRAYASFVMTWVGSDAARDGDWKAFSLLLREAYRHGKPTLVSTLLYLVIWVVPWEIRRKIAAPFEGSRPLQGR